MSDAAIVSRRSFWRPPPLLARLGVLAGLLALWEAASYAGLVNAFIAPPPSAIFASFEMLFVQEGLIKDVLVELGFTVGDSASGIELVEIVRGLAKDQRIVADPRGLVPGMPVKVVD